MVKRHAPSTARNSEAIAGVLAQELPDVGVVLEIASGSGEHAVFFARRFPGLSWQPTDLAQDALASVDAYVAEAGLENIRPVMPLDASASDWVTDQVDAIVCINMVHISPWDATVGLFAGALRSLAPSGTLILYGPYLEDGVDTAPSNLAFDQSLKARNPAWGLRQVSALDQLADEHEFTRSARYDMPANNLMLVYRRLRGG